MAWKKPFHIPNTKTVSNNETIFIIPNCFISFVLRNLTFHILLAEVASSHLCVLLIQMYARPEAIGDTGYAESISLKILKFYEDRFVIPYGLNKLGKMLSSYNFYTNWILMNSMINY